MTGPKDPPLQRGGGRVLILGGLRLAVAAAAALALGAEDVSLLRLGILAALWAALFGAFAAVRLRRELTTGAERAEELRTIYRLELDREISARREHELTVERELREQAERRERDELAALRGELQSLRETLRNLLGGDVLVERVALRAESTRLLPISDRSRPMVDVPGRVDGASAGPSRSLPVGESPRPETGPAPRTPVHRPDPPQRRQEPVDVPARPAAQSRPQQPPPRQSPPRQSPSRRETSPAAGVPVSGVPADAEPDIFTRTAADLAGKVSSADRSWSPAVAAPSRPGQAGSSPAGFGSARTASGWQPAVSSGPPSAHRRRADSRQNPAEPPPPPPAPVSPSGSAGEARSSRFQDKDPLGTLARPGTGTGRHSRPSVPRYGAAPAAPASTSNGANGNGAHSNGNGAHSNGNGATGGSYGSHAARQGGTGGRRAAQETPAQPPAGGRRVDELLAAYGDGAAPRRRRRRAED